uniref:RAP domain-containing protein n=1 Tax=Tetradesmus obliquus TaxID=3088 RepID=A0A383VGE5_TETOB|eukprot:jgi/Sobl393_1/16381/SZX63466.1
MVPQPTGSTLYCSRLLRKRGYAVGQVISGHLFVLAHRPGSKMVLQLTCSTLYRSRLLRQRGYAVVSVSYYEWREWCAAGMERQQLLRVIQQQVQHQQQQSAAAAAVAGKT